MNLDHIIEGYEQNLIQDLQTLIKIPSLLDESSAGPGAPFGKEVRKALDWYLNRAKEMGFDVKNVDGYAGHVEYGEGKELLGILAHLDVVPAGDNWQHPPFGGEIADGKLFGRGVMDNKGPAILALYALKALKDRGIVPDKRIRIIVGCDEESGMRCMEYYLQHEEQPTLGFSPDADFPLIHAEKGILHLRAMWQGQDLGLTISAGERPNVVPPKAEASLPANIKLPAKTDMVETDQARGKVTAMGLASHASVPQKGDNAIVRLLNYLKGVDLGEHSGKFEFLAKAGQGLNGEGLNVALSDEVSGPLTCNLGMLNFSQGKGLAVFDFRSPVTLPLEHTRDRAKAALEQEGFEVVVSDFDPPHYVPKDSTLVQKLLKVYREYTGDDSDALAIGGGTYARMLKGAVAFGPLLPGREDVAHIANEFMSLEDIRTCLKIYSSAILELVTSN